VNDNCDPNSTTPNCYYNSTQLTVTAGPGGAAPSTSSPAAWTLIDPATGIAPTFAKFQCVTGVATGCSSITVTATGQPSFCGSPGDTNVHVQVTLGGFQSAAFNVQVDWPQSLERTGTKDQGLSIVDPPGYLSYNTLRLRSGCQNPMFNMAYHEEFPLNGSGVAATWNTCGGQKPGWTDPVYQNVWASGISDINGILNQDRFDAVVMEPGCTNCNPVPKIPGTQQIPPTELDPTANAWSWQFIYVGSQDTATLGKYWPASPNKQVLYTDHGRDEPGTWSCPVQ
jgi:hypothetical protein